MKKQINIFSKLFIVFSLIFSVFVINAGNHEIHAREFNDVIIRTYITNRDGGVLNEELRQWQQFRFNADFKFPNGQIRGGDTTVIQLPNEITFSDVSPFEIRDRTNQVVAIGSLNKNNKTIVLTYTPAIENAQEVIGTLHAYMRVDHEVIESSATIQVNAVVGTRNYFAGDIRWKGLGQAPLFDIVKNGWKESLNDEKLVRYRIMVNTSKKQMDNLVVLDRFRAPGITYVPNTFKVYVGNWAWRGGEWTLDNQEDKTDVVTKRVNHSEFEIEIGNLPSNKGVMIDYSARINYEPVDGELFYNDAQLVTTNNVNTAVNSAYRYVHASGSAQGYTHTLKINKVNNQNQPVQNAVFEVIRKRINVVVGEITTDINGVGKLENLLKDDYLLKEKVVPTGYRKADDVEVSATDFDAVTKVAEKTIVNLPMEYIQISVNKDWIGKKQSNVEVKVFNENSTTAVASALLDENGNWEKTFTGLPKYNVDGSLAKYTVKETPIANYDTEVSGDQNTGFRIKNTNTEKISVNVNKLWNGPKLNQVEVKVFNVKAPTVMIATKEISEATGWEATFDNLPKYNEDGSEAQYNVVETPVANYESETDGNQTVGFTILNTNNEKVNVPVEKRWFGPKLDKIEVKLYNEKAPTQILQQVELKEANAWKHTFMNLPKYNEDGSEAKYLVEEVKLENYTSEITGDQGSGYLITNRNIEKISIPVTKGWVGPKTSGVEVKIFHKDDEVNAIETVEITEAMNWKYVFKDLPKYNQDGSEAQYIVKETPIANYDTQVSGDQNTGFRIKNTNTEVTELKVKKMWNGPKLNQVEVKVFNVKAPTVMIATKEISEATGWEATFDNLPKYNEDGSEAQYNVVETPVANYESETDGNQTVGFTILNTNNEKVNVPVEKRWFGPKLDKIEVKLYNEKAPTQILQQVELKEANAWKHTFMNLPKYNEDGSEAQYIVKETPIEGYLSEIKEENGVVIIHNTQIIQENGFSIQKDKSEDKVEAITEKNAKTKKDIDTGDNTIYFSVLSLLSLIGFVVARKLRK